MYVVRTHAYMINLIKHNPCKSSFIVRTYVCMKHLPSQDICTKRWMCCEHTKAH